MTAMRALLVLVALVLRANAIRIFNPAFDVRTVIPLETIHSVTFTPNGDLYTINTATTQVCRYPNAVNLPIGQTLKAPFNGTCYPTTNRGPGGYGTNIISSKTGRLYTVSGYEVDPLTGIRTPKFDNCDATHGLAIDPRDGALFFANVAGSIYRIEDPDLTPGFISTNCTAARYLSNTSYAVDGITVGPDGKVYAAGMQDRFYIFSPYSPSTPQATVIADVPATKGIRRPDGISICSGSGNTFALVATLDGSITKFNLTGPGGAPVYSESLVADSVGGYLDFTTVDPKGCIWGSDRFGTGGPYRVTNADGSCSCASAQVPDPPTGGCPNCSKVVTESYSGSGDFTVTHSSNGDCITLKF